MTIPIRSVESVTSEREPEPTGVLASHVIGALSGVDSWDALLVLGVGFLFAGLWLSVSLGVALAAVGGLLVVGGLMGARGKQLYVTNTQGKEG
jgi:hypothetical protein